MPAAVLAFDDCTAALVVQSLRTALVGGKWPPGGRRALFALVDALRDTSEDLDILDWDALLGLTEG